MLVARTELSVSLGVRVRRPVSGQRSGRRRRSWRPTRQRAGCLGGPACRRTSTFSPCGKKVRAASSRSQPTDAPYHPPILPDVGVGRSSDLLAAVGSASRRSAQQISYRQRSVRTRAGKCRHPATRRVVKASGILFEQAKEHLSHDSAACGAQGSSFREGPGTRARGSTRVGRARAPALPAPPPLGCGLSAGATACGGTPQRAVSGMP